MPFNTKLAKVADDKIYNNTWLRNSAEIDSSIITSTNPKWLDVLNNPVVIHNETINSIQNPFETLTYEIPGFSTEEHLEKLIQANRRNSELPSDCNSLLRRMYIKRKNETETITLNDGIRVVEYILSKKLSESSEGETYFGIETTHHYNPSTSAVDTIISDAKQISDNYNYNLRHYLSENILGEDQSVTPRTRTITKNRYVANTIKYLQAEIDADTSALVNSTDSAAEIFGRGGYAQDTTPEKNSVFVRKLPLAGFEDYDPSNPPADFESNIKKYANLGFSETAIMQILNKAGTLCEKYSTCLKRIFVYNFHIYIVYYVSNGVPLRSLLKTCGVKSNDYKEATKFSNIARLVRGVSLFHKLGIFNNNINAENVLYDLGNKRLINTNWGNSCTTPILSALYDGTLGDVIPVNDVLFNPRIIGIGVNYKDWVLKNSIKTSMQYVLGNKCGTVGDLQYISPEKLYLNNVVKQYEITYNDENSEIVVRTPTAEEYKKYGREAGKTVLEEAKKQIFDTFTTIGVDNTNWMLDNRLGRLQDIWSIGCTLFEMFRKNVETFPGNRFKYPGAGLIFKNYVDYARDYPVPDFVDKIYKAIYGFPKGVGTISLVKNLKSANASFSEIVMHTEASVLHEFIDSEIPVEHPVNAIIKNLLVVNPIIRLTNWFLVVQYFNNYLLTIDSDQLILEQKQVSIDIASFISSANEKMRDKLSAAGLTSEQIDPYFPMRRIDGIPNDVLTSSTVNSPVFTYNSLYQYLLSMHTLMTQWAAENPGDVTAENKGRYIPGFHAMVMKQFYPEFSRINQYNYKLEEDQNNERKLEQLGL